MLNSLRTLMVGTVMVLTACQASVEHIEGYSPDQRLKSYLIDARYRDGQVINTVMIWDTHSQRWVVNVSGHGSTWARAIITDILSPNVIPSLISGEYGIEIARQGCTSDCGNIINNTSSDSRSSSSNDVMATISSKGPNFKTITAELVQVMQRGIYDESLLKIAEVQGIID